ncbi:hypothetical protein C1645_795102 [Glomus cerebriforme]|uniref:BTB domain-containing protein n=1 Tax=Glomus cerebriforme TaxID=658196 RepID=A0A397RX80_9GLOM|nr:hypothetical protein C1645_795102 [Glomus cerebriforme]
MGLPITPKRKRVILPIYKQTDHTPAFYKDPFTNKLIPTAYFLKNLDEIGPQHWKNNYTSDFLLRVVRTTEIDYYCNYFSSLSSSSSLNNNEIINCSNSKISASEAADITCHFNVMLFNYQQQLLYNNIIQQQSLLSIQNNNQPLQQVTPPASPPISPTSFNNNKLQSSPSTSTYYFWSHTLVLATQSGFFNQLLGPINTLGNRFKYSNSLTIPLPYPEVFEPILHWLYHHDDDAWLDLITLENFPKFYANVSFLKLGREAYDVLDNFIEEAEEMGVDIDFDGIIESY